MISDDDKKAAQEDLAYCAGRISALAQQLRDLGADSEAWERKRTEIGLAVADLRNMLTPLVHWLDFYHEHSESQAG